MSTVFNTPKALALFPALETVDMNGKYSVILAWKKNSPELQIMRDACDEAIKEFFPDGPPTIFKYPFSDGNLKKYVDKNTQKESIRAGFEDSIYITVRHKDKPCVLDPTGNALAKAGAIQHGSIVILNTNLFKWEYMGKEGMSFGLNSLQDTGERQNIPGGSARPDPMKAHANVSGGAKTSPEDDPANYGDEEQESMFT